MSNNSVVVFGSNGFIGSSILNELQNKKYQTFGISRDKIDFTSLRNDNDLIDLVPSSSVVVFAAAKAPVRTTETFFENILIIRNFINIVSKISPKYILNISSDAIYPDSKEALIENLNPSPNSLHGLMHFSREMTLNQSFPGRVGHLRPTLVYGAKDPHNGYGPNSFIRLAMANSNLEVIGKGEELRDHIFVKDVATLALRMIELQIPEAVNAATGSIVSFSDLAKKAIEISGRGRIINIERQAPIPHNGYRPISIEKARSIFSEFHPIHPFEGLQMMYSEIQNNA